MLGQYEGNQPGASYELARAHSNLGNSLNRQKLTTGNEDLERSIAIYADLQERKPSLQTAISLSASCIRLGVVHNKSGRLDDARNYYTMAMNAAQPYIDDPRYQDHPKLQGSYRGAMGNRASLTNSISEQTEVSDFCRKVRLRNPLNVKAWKDELVSYNKLAIAYSQENQSKKCRDCLEKLVDVLDEVKQVIPERQNVFANDYAVATMNLTIMLIESDPQRAQNFAQLSCNRWKGMLKSAPEDIRIQASHLQTMALLLDCQETQQRSRTCRSNCYNPCESDDVAPQENCRSNRYDF